MNEGDLQSPPAASIRQQLGLPEPKQEEPIKKGLHGVCPPPGWLMVNEQWVPTQDTVLEAVRILLLYIGEDPARNGLLETPQRVVRAFREMTNGYREDPEQILGKRFKCDYDEMVVVKGIPFNSLCEHHLLPFSGTCSIGYIPKNDVVGLSKLPRLVHCFAKRLQLQERLTADIAAAIETYLDAEGVGVVCKAQHSCMKCRGVEMDGVDMLTSSCYGVFRSDPAARAEFFSLIS